MNVIYIYLLCAIPLILLIIRRLWIKSRKDIKNVCIVVFGDLGRSPRMQYHALSFAKEGFNVDFIGYRGSAPLDEIQNNSRITIHYLSHPPLLDGTNSSVKINRLSNHTWTLCVYFSSDVLGYSIILHFFVKLVWQCFTLTFLLFSKRISNYILIQNPPAIPTIPICWSFSIISEAKFIIDWHNYAHSIMALTWRKDHIGIKIAKFLEMYFGTKANYNFCVTKAMKDHLQQQWGIEFVSLKMSYQKKRLCFRL